MSGSVKQRIQDDMKAAMRAREKVRLGVIRLILAAIKQREVDERIELDGTQVLLVLEKMVKQRRDSIGQFSDAGRQDLADIESAELEIIRQYMPQPLSDAEVDAVIHEVITALGASSAQDMGRVMAALRPRLQGRAEMGPVSGKVKQRLLRAAS
ncbi:MAG: GatB/YqeY domain-containing protein [Gammaproteobacteria bacterium]|nr:GatB/YqeY domain-containing protein [Gammaproteobacteria bacterium]